jgi:hypothetical protein
MADRTPWTVVRARRSAGDFPWARLVSNQRPLACEAIGHRTWFLALCTQNHHVERRWARSDWLQEPLDWPDAALVEGDAVKVVARLKEESELPLRSSL